MRHRGSKASSPVWPGLTLIAAYAAAVVWGVMSHRLPWWTGLLSTLLNLATFIAYWQDKRAAQSHRWRTPESTLQLLALAGGWPGAWFAQQMLRHKTSKRSFQAVYWTCVVLHCAALAAWLVFRPLSQ